MKFLALALLLYFTPGLAAVNSALGNPEIITPAATPHIHTAANPKQDNDCVRGAAEPIVKKAVFPKTRFKLQPDKLTGIETVDLPNGDKLSIKNWGCEYFVLTFRFETTRLKGDPKNYQYWGPQAVTLMNGISKGIDAPINIQKGIRALAARCKAGTHKPAAGLKPGQEINFGGEDILSLVSLDRIVKLSDQKYAGEITFSFGPL